MKIELSLLQILLVGCLCQNCSHCKLAPDNTLPVFDMDTISVRYASNLMLTKLNSSPLPGKLIHFVIHTNCVTDFIKRVLLGSKFLFQLLKIFGIIQDVIFHQRFGKYHCKGFAGREILTMQ
jgi:hypothetical protein